MSKKVFRWCGKCKKRFDTDKIICPECGGVTKKVRIMNKKIVLTVAIITTLLVLLPLFLHLFGVKYFPSYVSGNYECHDSFGFCGLAEIPDFIFYFIKIVLLLVLYIFIVMSGIVITFTFFENKKKLKEIEKIEKKR